MVVGFSLLLIMPLVVIFFDQSNTLTDEINAAQVENIATKIMNGAEEVFLLGPPSKQVVRAQFPQQITDIAIDSSSITFTLTMGSTSWSFTKDATLPVNLSGSLKTHPGLHYISIQAQNGMTIIGEQS